SPLQPWAAALTVRMRRHLALKLVGTTAVIGLFFIAYLHLLHQPAYPVTVMPLTALDPLIPLQPQALFAYLSLWLYVGVGPGLQLNFRELVVYAAWIGVLCLTGLVIFYFWPTQVPPLALDVSHFPGFAMLQGVDAAGNACPSMHVTIATFTVIRIEDVLRRVGAPAFLRIFNVVWFLAIALSTLAIKQHVVLDAAAGALLGIVFALPSLRWRPSARQAAAEVVGHPPSEDRSRAGAQSVVAQP
ncbi:MAG TPA: phosphatase PAP2 family protein, partial [Caldimonas sp.]